MRTEQILFSLGDVSYNNDIFIAPDAAISHLIFMQFLF